MSLYILDTDIWSLHRLRHPLVQQSVAARVKQDLALTVITVEEQVSGWYTRLRQAKKRDEKAHAYQLLTDSIAAFSGWQLLSFSESAIIRYEQLDALKLNVGKNDLRIAAITLEHNAVLVSRNVRDFQRVPGLTVEDWFV